MHQRRPATPWHQGSTGAHDEVSSTVRRSIVPSIKRPFLNSRSNVSNARSSPSDRPVMRPQVARARAIPAEPCAAPVRGGSPGSADVQVRRPSRTSERRMRSLPQRAASSQTFVSSRISLSRQAAQRTPAAPEKRSESCSTWTASAKRRRAASIHSEQPNLFPATARARATPALPVKRPCAAV
jgi:hypothetical protein